MRIRRPGVSSFTGKRALSGENIGSKSIGLAASRQADVQARPSRGDSGGLPVAQRILQAADGVLNLARGLIDLALGL
jgi:hypothetical protein